MVGGDNLQRLKITKDDFFRYNTKLHKKMYKIDTRLTVKLSKEVGICCIKIVPQCQHENIAYSNCKAFFFCQNIKISSTGRAGSVGSVRDFFGLFSKTEQFSSGRLKILTSANVEDLSCPIYEPGNVGIFDMLQTENDKIFMTRPIFVSQEGKVLWVREGRFNWCITDRQEQVFLIF